MAENIIKSTNLPEKDHLQSLALFKSTVEKSISLTQAQKTDWLANCDKLSPVAMLSITREIIETEAKINQGMLRLQQFRSHFRKE